MRTLSDDHKKKLSEAMTKRWQEKNFRKNLVKKQIESGYRKYTDNGVQ